jgi:prepilin-type N-terminal cleavage/methylation domain-containing protein
MAVAPMSSTSRQSGSGPVDARRGGFTLIEALAALTLLGLLTALLFGTLAAQLRLARALADRAATADAVRVAAHVVGGEARRMTAADVRAAAPDSIAIRAFRGAGIVCAGEGALHVRYRGDRAPDPRKDSVLVVAAGAGPYSAGLTDVRPADGARECHAGPGEQLMQWTLAAGSRPAHGVLLVFEAGSYFLTARALRYRLGSEGRQPLTPELLLQPDTRFGGAAPMPGLVFTLVTQRRDTLRFAAPFGGAP